MFHFSSQTSVTTMSAELQHRTENDSIMSKEQSCGKEKGWVPKPTEVNGMTPVDCSGL